MKPRGGDDAALIQRLFDKAEAEHQQRKAAPYDGVMGEPPAWVPDWHRNEFFSLRDQLLLTKRVPSEKALRWLDAFTRLGERGYESATRHIPLDELDAVGKLASLRDVVSLGEEKGLKLLAGEDAVQGRAVMRGRRKGSKKTGDTMKAKGEETRRRVLAESDRLLRAGTLPRDLAGKIGGRHGWPCVPHVRKILKAQGVLSPQAAPPLRALAERAKGRVR